MVNTQKEERAMLELIQDYSFNGTELKAGQQFEGNILVGGKQAMVKVGEDNHRMLPANIFKQIDTTSPPRSS